MDGNLGPTCHVGLPRAVKQQLNAMLGDFFEQGKAFAPYGWEDRWCLYFHHCLQTMDYTCGLYYSGIKVEAIIKISSRQSARNHEVFNRVESLFSFTVLDEMDFSIQRLPRTFFS